MVQTLAAHQIVRQQRPYRNFYSRYTHVDTDSLTLIFVETAPCEEHPHIDRIVPGTTPPRAPKRKHTASTTAKRTKRTAAKNAFYRAPLPDLIAHHIPQSLRDFSFTLTPSNDTAADDAESSGSGDGRYEIEIHDNTTIPPDMFEACFRLVEFTSAATYKTSSFGWSAAGKKEQMADEDMRFLVLVHREEQRDDSKSNAEIPMETRRTASKKEHPEIGGFLSFMVTKEEGLPVIYVYEIHLHPMLQGKGLGSKLLSFVEFIGSSLQLDKVMLTAFKKNERAIQFYQRHGFEEDEISPRPTILRSGKLREWDYVILSKELESRK
ncbi:Acyl-CoA N-acyltransferase [Ascosphaera apis ARSEF 7405]|uniref:N-alpha-acetyltransferase 40 n=1 Tax=Ascosphaera apis ARSEF 7405 TaxID=392613 RepID=A0A162IMS6_9EURO|nr:Acyl-CoA N-acyltransferase [Ascosphaera apis ARSEF 7405]